MRGKIRHIHFVGIGGAGMSGIAEVLLNLGYQVSGSDLASNHDTQRLSAIGAHVWQGHHASHIAGADCVVASSAVPPTNPEILAAQAICVPVIPRAQMLAELMRLKCGIAIAGSHGKTTTTSLVATIFSAAGRDPTFVLGGRVNHLDSNAKLGAGEEIIVEADESDASFLHLSPLISVITNIDTDHVDSYASDFSKLQQAFIDFIHRLPFYGTAIVCMDCPTVRKLLPRMARRIRTYGLDATAEFRAIDIAHSGFGMRFTALRPNAPPIELTVNATGVHNVKNTLAAIAVADEFSLPDSAVASGLAQFSGVDRRFQSYGTLPLQTEKGEFQLIDDYAHHPVEIEATLSAIRMVFPGRRVLVVFQPHRFTRTRQLFSDFVRVLSLPDELLLTDIYPASEAPIPGVDSESLASSLRQNGQCTMLCHDLQALPMTVLNFAKNKDIVITMGAGSISSLASDIRQLALQSDRPTNQ